MATNPLQKGRHESILATIQGAQSSALWEDRLAAIDLADGLLGDLPSEGTVEHVLHVLDDFANDTKWEVRRAVVPVLLASRRPAARDIIERLAKDQNPWVRHAAERAKRKLTRITTPAAKLDKKARFAFDAIKNLSERNALPLYQAAIRAGEQSYEELAGDTAHELNTYRTAMDGLLQELQARLEEGSGATPAIAEILHKIHNRSRYLKALVSGLIEYSRDVDLHFEVHSLAPIVIEALELAKEKTGLGFPAQRVDVVQAVPSALEVEVCRDRFLQALVNILSNALESLPDGADSSRITIAAQVDGETVSITIADTGIGMDAAQLESATKRFRSLKKAKGGIGLGLPLAVKIVEREHGGTFDIDSTVGVGTTVTVEVAQRRETA